MKCLLCALVALSAVACESPGPGCDTVPDVPPPAFDPVVNRPTYGADNPFAQAIGDAPALSPDSDAQVAGLVAQAAEGFQVVASMWSSPVVFADASTPTVDVALTAGWAPFDTLLDVPMPAWAAADPSGDGHLAIVDLDAGLEYDLWQVCPPDATASWGNLVSLDGPGVFREGLSARGSGFALMNGMIWPHELAQGHIDHALLFSYDLTRAGGPVAPATESDGTGRGPDTLPEGARVQLDPALDVTTLGLTPAQETIARALQEYGMILGDDGGGLSLYAVGPRSFPEGEAVYDGLIEINGDGWSPMPASFPVARLRVLAFGAQDPNASSEASVAYPARFE